MLTPALLLLPFVFADPEPIDFTSVPERPREEAAYLGSPRYGMFLFGAEGRHAMWAVLDQRDPEGEVYDVLHLDLDADGVLGEEGERFEGVAEGKGRTFTIGDLRQPGSEAVHTDFEVTWTPDSVRWRMHWRGGPITWGGYGPKRETYAGFSEDPAEATVYVPGFDRPLEFEHWMSDELVAGESKDFKVFVGARGSVRGAFSCGDDEFLPEGEYLLATLIYRDLDGKTQRFQAKLRERC